MRASCALSVPLECKGVYVTLTIVQQNRPKTGDLGVLEIVHQLVPAPYVLGQGLLQVRVQVAVDADIHILTIIALMAMAMVHLTTIAINQDMEVIKEAQVYMIKNIK